jgi:CRISPR-associated endonuclease Cas3-HD
MFLAHSANDHGKRHELATHLRAVADKAAEFAGSFGSDKIAWYIGLWHDLGKFSSPFQQYLLDCEQNPEARGHGPDHKAAGAEIAREHLPWLRDTAIAILSSSPKSGKRHWPKVGAPPLLMLIYPGVSASQELE